MKPINLKIKTANRPGITFETIEIFNKYNIDILQLEVLDEVIFVKFSLQKENLQQQIYSELLTKKFVDEVIEIDYFPSELYSNQIIQLFSKFNEAIVITNRSLEIQFQNDSFSKLNPKKLTSLNKLFIKYPKINEAFIQNSHEFFEVTLITNEVLNTSIHLLPSNLNDEMYYIWVFYFNDEFQKKFIKPIQQSLNKLEDLVYKSSQMSQLVKTANAIAGTDVTVLIRGESGTGKELFSRGIHFASKRKEFPFVTVNCSAIPDSLIESELFGHEGGAFTGSLKNGKKGLFEQANKGTILLDEIGDLPFHLQSKLLRVIENKTIRRLGSETEIELDVRIIAATNQPLEEFIENNLFRLDLFYRLNVHSISIPPLRFRKEDISPLIDYFLKKYTSLFNRKVVISENARIKMINHNWPGNIRELGNTIERSILMSTKNILDSNDIKINESVGTFKSNLTMDISGKTYRELLNDFEKMVFTDPQFKHKSTREIANELKISHTSVANKLNKYR